MSDDTETAILAAGCYWPAEELLRRGDGVISTRVGYTGGELEHPTDANHPGHAEAVEIVFDPERISYRDILEYFFQIHRADLGEDVVGSLYRSEIFYTTEEQRRVAEETIPDVDAARIWPGKVVTRISKAGPFWEATASKTRATSRLHPDGYTCHLPRNLQRTDYRATDVLDRRGSGARRGAQPHLPAARAGHRVDGAGARQ